MLQFFLLLSATLLLVDTLFLLIYFDYTYFLELKRRFSIVGKDIPEGFRNQLKREIRQEVGTFKMIVQSLYVPWFIMCFFQKLWFLPVTITLLIGITNTIFYRKSYISPLMLMFNLIIVGCCYGYTIVYLIMQYLK